MPLPFPLLFPLPAPLLIPLLLLLPKPQTCQSNLICNGDFEAYNTTAIAVDSSDANEYFTYVNGASNCWYRYSLDIGGLFKTQVEVKLTSGSYYGVASKVADLVSFGRYQLCQRPTLQPGMTYLLNYTTLLDPKITESTLCILLNGLTIFRKSYTQIRKQYPESVSFKPLIQINQICFSPEPIQYVSGGIFSGVSYGAQFGIMVDNVSLVAVGGESNSSNVSGNTTVSNNTVANASNATNSTNTVSNSSINTTSNNTTINNTNTTNNSNTNISSQNFTNTTNTSNTSNTTNISNTTNSTNTSSTSNTTNTINTTNTNNTTDSTNTTNFTNTTNTTNTTSSNNISNENSNNTTNNTNINNTNNISNLNDTNITNISIIANITNATNNSYYFNSTNITNSTVPIPIPANWTNSTPIPIPIPTPTPTPTPTPGKQTITINCKSQSEAMSDKVIIHTDFRPGDYSMPLKFFQNIVIQIQGIIQNTPVYYLDKDNTLAFSVSVSNFFDSESIRTLKIHLPDNQLTSLFLNLFNFIFIIDNHQLSPAAITVSERGLVERACSVFIVITQVIKKIFLVSNSLYCSYFLINFIGFYNLALLYIFLQIRTVPSFARNFLNLLAYVFFNRGSVTEFISSILKTDEKISFTYFPLQERIASTKDGYNWFGNIEQTSNFLENNVESLILLSLFFVKFFLVKLFLWLLPKRYRAKLKTHIGITSANFYQHLQDEICCYVPFFIVSAFQSLLRMGQNNWNDGWNCGGHVLMFGVCMLMGCVGVVEQLGHGVGTVSGYATTFKTIAIDKAKSKNRDRVRTKYRLKTFDRYEQILLCFAIPLLISVESVYLFFLIVTPIHIWRLYFLLSHRKALPCLKFLSGLLNKVIWLVYHFTFLSLLVIQLMKVELKKIEQVWKVMGFVIIGCVIVGALVDIIGVLAKILVALAHVLKILWKNLYGVFRRRNAVGDDFGVEQMRMSKEKNIKAKTKKVQQKNCIKTDKKLIDSDEKKTKPKTKFKSEKKANVNTLQIQDTNKQHPTNRHLRRQTQQTEPYQSYPQHLQAHAHRNKPNLRQNLNFNQNKNLSKPVSAGLAELAMVENCVPTMRNIRVVRMKRNNGAGLGADGGFQKELNQYKGKKQFSDKKNDGMKSQRDKVYHRKT